MAGWLRRRKRRRLLSQAFPLNWPGYLAANVRQYNRLDEPQTESLHRCIRVLVAEKSWEGCDGLDLTDEMGVTIAGHAALMLLGTPDYYFDGLKTVLVYPRSFARDERQGFLVRENVHRSGEAWQGGPIIVSWQDVLWARSSAQHYNVVIHEFAHFLDGIDGVMDGRPVFDTAADQATWNRVVSTEFASLVRDVSSGNATLMRAYGATNETEFFAVASECFFERPVMMNRRHRVLYEILQKFYRVDPVTWST